MSETLLADLNAAQRAAVTHKDGPLLVVAGAGTGKTTVLTRRYAHVLEAVDHDPSRILALTFTDKAAGEIEDRILQLLPVGTYDFWISTFHGFCQRVLEAHGLEIGLPNRFHVLTPTDAWLLLRRHLEELPLVHYKPLGNPVKFLRGLLQHLSRAKDEGISPETYKKFAEEAVLSGDETEVASERARLHELADLYAAYRGFLLQEDALDFGDLILETLRLFRERPMVLKRYQDQFSSILVDEFQDTNWAQYELLKLLAGSRQAITVVGDDDQAIYKFRGASLANILQFRRDFPTAKTITLIENYRSKKEILDQAYQFICKNNPNRLEVSLQELGLSKQLQAMKGEGGCVDVLWAQSVGEEADRVIEKIRAIKHRSESVRWSDFAILVRSNDGAEPFLQALDQARIPFQFLALRGLYTKPVIVDILALLSVLDGYHDSSMVWRALTLPGIDLGGKDLAELLQCSTRKGHTLWQTVLMATQGQAECSLSDRGRAGIGRITQFVQALGDIAKRKSAMQVFQQALEESGYLKHLLGLSELDKRDALRHLNAFAERIKRYEQASISPSLRGFLEEFRLELESGEEGALNADPESGPDTVKILTVHAAKGLEFPYVFLVSLVDQRFPTRARTDAIPLPDGLVQERLPEGDYHVEEERRLFYVAMTRAKDELYCTGAFDYGGSREKKPSAFLAEAGLVVPQSKKEEVINLTRGLTVSLVAEEETVPATDLQYYQLKRTFSFTQLASFRKCPLQYKFAHLFRIPVLGSFQKSFGQSMHLVFQRLLQLHLARTVSVAQPTLFEAAKTSLTTIKGLAIEPIEADQVFDDAWIDEWYPTRTQHDAFYAKGKVALGNFIQAYKDTCPQVLEVEKPFTLLLGTHALKGKIDRIDRNPDGTVTIFDYKTGEAKDKLEIEDKEQLYLYQVALEEKGIKVSRLAYIYVLDWTITDVEPLKEKAKETFLEKMRERMDAVLRSTFPATPESHVCRTCDFRHICEFKKS
jgi:DNA helicase-2/ATP-dependent DNA helicase PcrA